MEIVLDSLKGRVWRNAEFTELYFCKCWNLFPYVKAKSWRWFTRTRNSIPVRSLWSSTFLERTFSSSLASFKKRKDLNESHEQPYRKLIRVIVYYQIIQEHISIDFPVEWCSHRMKLSAKRVLQSCRVWNTREKAKTTDSGRVLSLPAVSPLLARNKLSARKISLTLVAC